MEVWGSSALAEKTPLEMLHPPVADSVLYRKYLDVGKVIFMCSDLICEGFEQRM